MDSIEVRRHIRLERPELPVILISGRYSAEIRQRALDEGPVEFLYKPFEALGLLEAIQTALTSPLLARASKE
jgi:FixJ family two-component response regulator